VTLTATIRELDDVSDDFPEEFFKMKVLPELLKSVEFGGGGPKVLGVIMKIGAKLSDDEFESRITPVIVRLFASPDRAMRVCLLDNLPSMIDQLPQKVVNDKIFPQMVGVPETCCQLAHHALGHRVYRYCPCGPRTNCEGSAYGYLEAL
jgi:hypothetical protein